MKITQVFLNPRLGCKAIVTTHLMIILLTGMGNLYADDNLKEKTLIKTLSFNSAVEIAQKNDPWLSANQHTEQSIKAMSEAANSYKNPSVSLGFANLPTDSFNLNQEPMTQVKFSVSQVFPRGDTLLLKQQQLALQSRQYPYMRQDRQAKVKVTVGQLWLQAFKADKSISLIESNRSLFEQLSAVAESKYTSGIGKTRQQDIIRAQLELTQLEDRLTVLEQQYQGSKQQLAQWVSSRFTDQQYDQKHAQKSRRGSSTEQLSPELFIDKQLPTIALLEPQIFEQVITDQQQMLSHLIRHPSITALDQMIQSSKTGIELAKQKYKTQWAVNASYGMRDEAPVGVNREDLFSIGVSFDLPIFTNNRQDQQLKSARSKTESVKTQRWILLRNLFTAFEKHKANLHRSQKRQSLYQQQLLPLIRQQAEASLTAYTNDEGDFAEVVRARIAVLNAELDALNIDVKEQMSILQLNYFFAKSSGEKS